MELNLYEKREEAIEKQAKCGLMNVWWKVLPLLPRVNTILVPIDSPDLDMTWKLVASMNIS